MELVTVPRVPILRTGHYDLESGPVDFAQEHLTAAAAALANDPAVLPLRLRLELEDQGHLNADAMVIEAAGGQGGPAVGWGDNYTVDGNTLYADLHVPELVAASMEWAFPGRSIEGLHGYTTATGQRHDFILTGCLLLGTSWPGVTTLPDFHEVQAEFAAAAAAGEFDTTSFATATLLADQPRAREALEASAVVARVGATARPPAPARDQLVAAGLNVADLRQRWYAAESNGDLEGLPDSYDFWSWYVTETRVDDDGNLYVLVYDEASAREWRFDAQLDGADVTWGEPYEVMRPDPVPVAASGTRPRPALARFNSRAESRAATASAHNPPNQEDDRPMNDALRRALATRHGLDPETATEDQITAAETAAPEADADSPENTDTAEGADEAATDADRVPAGVNARTRTVSADVLANLERDAAAGAAARAAQIEAERTALVTAALQEGRITPAEAGLTRNTDGSWPEGWRRDLEDAPEVTARALTRLEAGKYPGAAARTSTAPTNKNPGSLTRALASSGLSTNPAERKGA
ncbi:MAG: phage protease [Chloroflexi bacterium]|nr:phage protease [Chloroflexota bacterium]